MDPAIESHYGTGYERGRLFPGGTPALEFVRSMELLDRLLPGRSQPGVSLPGRTQMSRSCMSSICRSITSRRYSA